VKTVNEFVALIQDEVGLAVTPEDVPESFDRIPGWDSLHLLTLLGALERETGRRLSMPAVLEARSLHDIYALAVSE
jgi:acyl carrier protein